MAKVVFDGLVDPGCMWVPPESPYYDRSLKCTGYDPADAKRLVAASGVASPTVRILVTNADQQRLAQFLKDQEGAVGIDVQIETAPQTIRDVQAKAGKFDTIVGGWTGGPDVDRNVFQFLHTSGSRNWSGYSNARLDLILENSRKAASATALKTLYHAAAQIVLADRPIIYLYHVTRFTGVRDDVAGVQVGPDILARVAFAQLR
jgi:peptide/nickel transport system substrate-binding protein